jgi:hypothetical protein
MKRAKGLGFDSSFTITKVHWPISNRILRFGELRSAERNPKFPGMSIRCTTPFVNVNVIISGRMEEEWKHYRRHIWENMRLCFVGSQFAEFFSLFDFVSKNYQIQNLL